MPPSAIRPTRDRTTPADLRQCGADGNQIDQDELFDCHVNNRPVAGWVRVVG
ncbi:hypothetical protein MRB56_00350 [Halomonas cupida]|uniref:hypothetical protein n=1 Tax=Halomonas cupida TaxID=44933 RepID=UPI0039B669C0